MKKQAREEYFAKKLNNNSGKLFHLITYYQKTKFKIMKYNEQRVE
jgi:hypothetical protein